MCDDCTRLTSGLCWRHNVARTYAANVYWKVRQWEWWPEVIVIPSEAVPAAIVSVTRLTPSKKAAP